MITIEAVNSDLDKIAEGSTSVQTKEIVAIVKIVMKFLSTVRSNQLLSEADKISLKKIKENRKTESK